MQCMAEQQPRHAIEPVRACIDQVASGTSSNSGCKIRLAVAGLTPRGHCCTSQAVGVRLTHPGVCSVRDLVPVAGGPS